MVLILIILLGKRWLHVTTSKLSSFTFVQLVTRTEWWITSSVKIKKKTWFAKYCLNWTFIGLENTGIWPFAKLICIRNSRLHEKLSLNWALGCYVLFCEQTSYCGIGGNWLSYLLKSVKFGVQEHKCRYELWYLIAR